MKVDSLEPLSVEIDKTVQEIDAKDPWVADNFGKEGTGEGLVMYPINISTNGLLLRDTFTAYIWKAKGKSHQVVADKKSVVVTPEIVASIEEYCDLMVTEGRLKQGFGEIKGPPEKSKIGAFVKWMVEDVQKEGEDELEASGLQWRQVATAISKRASKWYTDKCVVSSAPKTTANDSTTSTTGDSTTSATTITTTTQE